MPTEKRFEDFIEKSLLALRDADGPEYNKLRHENYDRKLCLIPAELLAFIKRTQEKKWEELERNLGDLTENKFLETINEAIERHGVLKILREGHSLKGQKFDIAYFEPKSGNNPDALTRFKKNKFTIIRQLHYSEKNQNSLDTGIFLNGIPILTIELKNHLTGQSIQHARSQYKTDRDPKEPFVKI